ncbi:MAG: hydroxyethylthiazole kinase [Actinomycetota bacterium]
MDHEISQILTKASQSWDRIEEKKPLIHHITNFVAMAEQAHLTLALGASPVMAPDLGESSEMASHADALLLNIGTPSQEQLDSMLSAHQQANKKGISVLLDPVGYGATKLRNRVVLKILDNGPVSIIKGNHGEVSALAGSTGTVKGVDSKVTGDSNLKNTVDSLAKKYNAVVVSTGKKDLISDGSRVISVAGGNPLLTSISGSGCWLGTIIASAAAVSDDAFTASLSGTVALKLASERIKPAGVGMFRISLLDKLAEIKGEDLLAKGDAIKWI